MALSCVMDSHKDDLAQMSFFQQKVVSFWIHHPGDKARLIPLDAQWPWDSGKKEDNGSRGQSQKGAPPLLQRHEFPFTRKHRFQHGNEGHLPVHLRIAERYGSLPGEHLKNFQVRRGEKVGVGTFKAEHSHAAGIIA